MDYVDIAMLAHLIFEQDDERKARRQLQEDLFLEEIEEEERLQEEEDRLQEQIRRERLAEVQASIARTNEQLDALKEKQDASFHEEHVKREIELQRQRAEFEQETQQRRMFWRTVLCDSDGRPA